MSRTAFLKRYYEIKRFWPNSYDYHVTLNPKIHGTSRKEWYHYVYKFWLKEDDLIGLIFINETAPETGMEHGHGIAIFRTKQQRQHLSTDKLTILYRSGDLTGWVKYCTKGKRKINVYFNPPQRQKFFRVVGFDNDMKRQGIVRIPMEDYD